MNGMVMKYKHYKAKIEYNDEYKMFYGRVLGIRDVISFHGKSVDELQQHFSETIEDYIKTCKEIGKDPERSYGGAFNVRPGADVHKDLAMLADEDGVSLNQIATQAFKEYIEKRMSALTA